MQTQKPTRATVANGFRGVKLDVRGREISRELSSRFFSRGLSSACPRCLGGRSRRRSGFCGDSLFLLCFPLPSCSPASIGRSLPCSAEGSLLLHRYLEGGALSNEVGGFPWAWPKSSARMRLWPGWSGSLEYPKRCLAGTQLVPPVQINTRRF